MNIELIKNANQNLYLACSFSDWPMARYGTLLLFLLLLAGAGRLHAQQPIVITQGSGLIDVGSCSATFLDETSLISGADIAAGKYSSSFSIKGKEAINYGVTDGTSWCIFRLANAGKEKVYLSVNNPIVDTIKVYAIRGGMAMQIGMGSVFMPVSTRQITTENYMFDLGAGADTTTYLLSYKSARGHIYSLSVGCLADHTVVISRTLLWNAVFMGFALLMALYHLFLFLTIRNIPYLYYVGYVTCLGLFISYINGGAFLYLWPEHPQLNYYDNILGSATGFFAGMFTVSSLGVRKYAPRYVKVIYAVIFLYAANIVISLLGYSYASYLILRLIVPVWIAVTIVGTIKVLLKGYKPARFFLVAWVTMAINVAVFMLSNYNLIGCSFYTTHALQIGGLTEALALSFALADRFITYKEERETLMRTQNEMLEHKVAERTEQLNKQQRETEQLLLNILPEEVAAELKENGAARSRNYEAVTVLFTDFKDFTRIVESISPEQLIAHLNHCFSAFDKIIEKYGIEKIKTIGDSYMCAGGFGTKDPDNVLKVVRAGIEIRNFINERNIVEAQKPNGIILEVRIGIHTGPVIAGIVGIKKFAYDIWGDTVNIASRMESAGLPGKVNISGITYEVVKDHFTCTHRGRMPAKNKGDIDMYFVEWK